MINFCLSCRLLPPPPDRDVYHISRLPPSPVLSSRFPSSPLFSSVSLLMPSHLFLPLWQTWTNSAALKSLPPLPLSHLLRLHLLRHPLSHSALSSFLPPPPPLPVSHSVLVSTACVMNYVQLARLMKESSWPMNNRC